MPASITRPGAEAALATRARASTMRPEMRPLVLACVLLLSACAAEIGDECLNSTDCSPEGDRICDFAQAGGYCTIKNCAPDQCPDDALCVRFGDEPRFERTYCMAACSGGSDCRDGYTCTAADDSATLVIDEDRSGRFCAPSP